MSASLDLAGSAESNLHPQSVTPHILQSIQVFDLTFNPEEMKQLKALNKNQCCIVPMIMVDGGKVPGDARHPRYPFNDLY